MQTSNSRQLGELRPGPCCSRRGRVGHVGFSALVSPLKTKAGDVPGIGRWSIDANLAGLGTLCLLKFSDCKRGIDAQRDNGRIDLRLTH